MGLLAVTDTGYLPHISHMALGIGGAESNVAVAPAHLGTPVVWTGRLGADSADSSALPWAGEPGSCSRPKRRTAAHRIAILCGRQGWGRPTRERFVATLVVVVATACVRKPQTSTGQHRGLRPWRVALGR
ncbi:hypothetical protein ACWFR5_14565 [Streptomyces sp. NPDC055092]